MAKSSKENMQDYERQKGQLTTVDSISGRKAIQPRLKQHALLLLKLLIYGCFCMI